MDGTYIPGYPSSNVYSFSNTMKNRMKVIYTYNASNRGYAHSSLGYRVNSCCFGDSVFWAPAYEVCFGKLLSRMVGSMEAGSGQIAAKEGTFRRLAPLRASERWMTATGEACV